MVCGAKLGCEGDAERGDIAVFLLSRARSHCGRPHGERLDHGLLRLLLGGVEFRGRHLAAVDGKGGLTYPEGLAIDGAGAAWATAYRGNVIAGFGAASGGAASAVLSPAAGYGLDANLSEPFGAAVDASGNLWVASFGNSTVVQFVGLATPVKTPVVGSALGSLGYGLASSGLRAVRTQAASR